MIFELLITGVPLNAPVQFLRVVLSFSAGKNALVRMHILQYQVPTIRVFIGKRNWLIESFAFTYGNLYSINMSLYLDGPVRAVSRPKSMKTPNDPTPKRGGHGMALAIGRDVGSVGLPSGKLHVLSDSKIRSIAWLIMHLRRDMLNVNSI